MVISDVLHEMVFVAVHSAMYILDHVHMSKKCAKYFISYESTNWRRVIDVPRGGSSSTAITSTIAWYWPIRESKTDEYTRLVLGKGATALRPGEGAVIVIHSLKWRVIDTVLF